MYLNATPTVKPVFIVMENMIRQISLEIKYLSVACTAENQHSNLFRHFSKFIS